LAITLRRLAIIGVFSKISAFKAPTNRFNMRFSGFLTFWRKVA
jgi:hypothetical protein